MGTKGSIFATRRTIDALSHMTGERHGRPWLTSELVALERWFKEGKTLQKIVELSGRSTGSVIPKLQAARLIQAKPATVRIYEPDYVYAVDIDEPTEQPVIELQPIEEQTMTIANIENKILIQGQDAANLSDDQIFDLIAKLEGQQARLKSIDNKPKKLTAKIEALSNDIALLVEYVDGR